MSYFAIRGLPEYVQMKNLYFELNDLFHKYGMEDVNYRISGLSDIPGSMYKECIVEFDHNQDPYMIFKALNMFVYKQGGMEYVTEVDKYNVRGNDRRVSPYHGNDRRQGGWQDGRNRVYHRRQSRSRSPLNREATKLDLEIELLRKKRQVIEEERRLVMEQKKLELARDFGHGSSRRSVNYDERDRRPPRRYEERRPAKRSPRPPRNRRKAFTGNSKSLPFFVLPCKRIVSEMKPLFITKLNNKKSAELIKHITTVLRKRISVALEGKDYTPTQEIVKLYRKLYPRSLDEKLVNKLLVILKHGPLPESGEGNNENDTETKEDTKETKLDCEDSVTDNNEAENPKEGDADTVETSIKEENVDNKTKEKDAVDEKVELENEKELENKKAELENEKVELENECPMDVPDVENNVDEKGTDNWVDGNGEWNDDVEGVEKDVTEEENEATTN